MNKKALIKTVLWMLKAVALAMLAFFGSVTLGVTLWLFLDSLPDAVVVIGGTLVFIIIGFSLVAKDKYDEFKKEEV